MTIVIIGSTRDIAWALDADPDLTNTSNIRSVWVVAGDADLALPPSGVAEWNAAADPGALAFLFDSGPPIVWIPPFDGGSWTSNGRASWFMAPVGDLFSDTDPEVRDATIHAWHREWDSNAPPTKSERDEFEAGVKSLWLSGLLTPIDPETGMLTPVRECSPQRQCM